MNNRFESLELQGFKTFATTTRLEFPGQITAIVGPNGSGKSNIADSVRWVLGEQAYTLLRAKRTEDMIFSGSQQRSRAGMASTRITFNNVDGWLPIDFSTVSISRRAFRDGQNEYILNGQKVRLKDISELLSQTGLAERTYTIIGQGLVDVALALKPDERRKLFEEAAGLGLYRSRKEDALKRLTRTERNLERVLDILTEIKPRLRSLERHAGRFTEYEIIRSDLQKNLNIWYGYQWYQSQKEVNQKQAAFHDQEVSLKSLQSRFNENRNKEQKLQAELLEKRNSLELTQSELLQQQQGYEKLTRELAIVEERQSAYQVQKQNLEVDISKFDEELIDLTAQNDTFEQEIVLHQEELTKADIEVNQTEISLTEVSGERETAQAKLNISRQTRINLETRKVQLSVRHEELENRFASLSKEQMKIEQALTSLQEDNKLSGKKENSILKELDVIKHITSGTEDEAKTLSDKLENAYSKKQSLEHRISDLETKLAKVKAQLEVLNQAEAALSGFSEGSKLIVHGSKQGRLPRGIEPLSKFFIVDEIYEKAISAALGELTDLLVVPSGGKDVLIKYLESKDSDRVALIVTDELPTRKKPSQYKSEEGYIGLANNLLQVESRYEELIEQLLGDTVVVENRKSAQQILHKLKGTQKVVTLNGLVFQANGVMISGQSSSGKRISRSRRRNEMQQEIKDLNGQVNLAKIDVDKVSTNSHEIEEKYQSLQQKIRHNVEKQNNILKQRQDIREILTRLNEQLSWHQNQLITINQQLVENQTKKELTTKDLESCKEEISVLLSEERADVEILNKLSVFDLQQSLNYWTTHRIVAKNSLQAAQQRSKDHLTRVDEAQQRLGNYQSRLSFLENSIIDIKKIKTQLSTDVDNLEGIISIINSQQISPITTAVQELEEKISQVQAKKDQSQNEIIPAERILSQLQLELMQKNDRISNLTEKIEDDFGLVTEIKEMTGTSEQPFSVMENIINKLPSDVEIPENIDVNIKRQKRKLRGMGSINPESQQEFIEVKERYEFLENQVIDLQEAGKNLKEVIETLDSLMERDFLKTFQAVGQGFTEYFKRLFNGGDAKLSFFDEDNPVEGGIDMIVRLPGRRQQSLALLSGGERSLTAVALIFALLKVSPTPFCILDEVDAMLDETNVGRFIELLRELSTKTQFIIITHNRNTVQAADVIYGVTMGRDSTSQMISLKLEDVDETYVD